MYYGLILIIEKFVLKKLLDKLPSAISHVYTIFVFIFGWVIFYFDDMGKMGDFIVGLFNFSDGLISADALVILCRYAVLLAVAVLASTPLMTTLYLKLRDKGFMWVLETVFCVVVMVISVAAIVNQSYNPFLYFRF